MTRVLVIDDVPAMAEQYAYDLGRLGSYDTLVATGGEEGLDTLDREAVDCIILDLEMPEVDGFEVLRQLAGRHDRTPVIVYTGTGTYDRCIEAVRLGAFGFVDKAEPMQRVVQEVANAVQRRQLLDEVAALREQVGGTTLIGGSEPMRLLREAIGRVAPIPSPVLVEGESGSGKELVARELHRLGAHPDAPLIAVNCAALPEQLVESELFGHERGAFTGAHRLRQGAFEAAGAGTLFLDEIGDMPLAVQAKLLRVLEDRSVTRLGGNRTVRVGARVVAATNRDLSDEVRAGRFREDLLFRLNVHVLTVPPLRERRSDIAELTRHFVAKLSADLGLGEMTLADDATETLMAYDWRRNNVRELRNIIERMMISATGNLITRDAIPADIRSAGSPSRAPAGRSFKEQKAEAERQIIVAALERNRWQVTQTARDLGLADHASLLKIMRKHGIRSR